jgi:hypothetical protein
MFNYTKKNKLINMFYELKGGLEAVRFHMNFELDKFNDLK